MLSENGVMCGCSLTDGIRNSSQVDAFFSMCDNKL